MDEDQHEVVAFLGDPASYGAGVERVEMLETHASRVFLAGDRAYKLKRAVVYPYLDFATVAKRQAACRAELALNRRTAPELYLELRAVVRRPDGRLGFAGGGDAVDWVVVMRRFDEALLFDRLATAGRLDAALADALADRIADFHAGAEIRRDSGGTAAMAAIVVETRSCLEAAPAFDARLVAELGGRWQASLAAAAAGLEARRAAGKVRRCHGDLHLRNICLYDGRPTLFDCLEFSEPLASIDVLYDLAFLLMDLEHRGLGGVANRVLNRYLDRTEEADGLGLMPFFLSLRAAIRAHVTQSATATVAAAERGEPRSYLALARRCLEPPPPRLVAIGGPSGGGKSTLAALLAPELGARVLRSDVIRKRLFGVSPETKLSAEAYTAAQSRRVYRALYEAAASALAAGCAVVVDAVCLRPEERHALAAIAARAGVPFAGLWLAASPAVMAARICARRRDASDATPEILDWQLRQDPGPIDWTRIEAGTTPEACLAAARRALGAGRE